MRIIIADDERPARFFLRSCLEEQGIDHESIVEAADGQELLRAAALLKPSSAFVDVRMPGMDGLEAIEAARKESPETHWAIVSSYAEFEYARRALKLGISEYLLKPVDPVELGLCLQRMGLSVPNTASDELLGPVLEYLQRNYNAEVSVSDAAAISSLSPNYLSTLFHSRMGMTIRDYISRLRIEEAVRLLDGGLALDEAARAVGYTDLRYFSRKYREVTGRLPSRRKV